MRASILPWRRVIRPRRWARLALITSRLPSASIFSNSVICKTRSSPGFRQKVNLLTSEILRILCPRPEKDCKSTRDKTENSGSNRQKLVLHPDFDLGGISGM